MCGIAGLFLKDRSLEPNLGAMLSDMLVTLTDRGPDSAGIAIYGAETPGATKITVQSATPAQENRASMRPPHSSRAASIDARSRRSR